MATMQQELTGELSVNPLGIWYYEKLRIDFVRNASLIALVWAANQALNVKTRCRKVSGAHEKNAELLLQIDTAS
jgi:hypothetical protein